MFLKSIELLGFKTFPEKTEISLAPGITAIVGPNGSGKSNLVDAILWALGEQSPRALRSKNLEEMIFLGNKVRKPLNLAEVSLTLDNLNGDLPLSFSEIYVTRRIFRDGQSEYFLNKVPCRLRDIQELFLDTGVGKDSFCVMTQNDVDLILSRDSEELRSFFEGAAGIQKYKFQKREALRKLERTHQNLLRVGDLIYELEGQLEPLAEKAQKAKEYQELMAQLKKLELSLLLEDYYCLLVKIHKIQKREAELQTQIADTEKKIIQATSEAEALKEKLLNVNLKLEEHASNSAELSQQVEKMEGKISILKEKILHLTEQRTSIKALVKASEEKILQAEAKLQQSLQEQKEVKRQIGKGSISLAEKERKLEELNKGIAFSLRKLEEQKEAHIEIIRQIAEKRNQASNLKYLIETAHKQIDQLKIELETQKMQEETNRQESQNIDQEIRLLQTQIPELKDKLQNYETEGQKLEKELQSKLEKASELKETLSEKRQRCQILSEIESNLQGYHKGVQAVLRAKSQGVLEGNYCPLSQLIQVSTQYALSLEAALGEKLQNIVVDTEEEAKRALEFLKTNLSGRATFLPLNLIRQRIPPRKLFQHNLHFQGLVGKAVDLIKFDPKYAPIINYLLGDTLIVENLKIALEKTKELNCRLVTLQGDLIEPSGAITGGYYTYKDRPIGQGLLTRKAEWKELQEALGHLEVELSKVNILTEKNRANLNQINSEIKEIQETVAMKEALLAEKKSQRDRLIQETERLREERDRKKQESQALLDEISGLQRLFEELTGQLEHLEKQKENLEITFQQISQDKEKKETQKSQLLDAMTTLRIEDASLTQRLAALNEIIEELQRNLGELKENQKAKKAELEQLDKEEQQLKEMLEEEKKRLAQVSRAKTALETEIESLKGKKEELIQRSDRQSEIISQLRAFLDKLNLQHHKIELNQTKLEAEKNYLQRSLWENFGIASQQALAFRRPVKDKAEAISQVAQLKQAIQALGTPNLGAIEEYENLKQRHKFLSSQRQDLKEGQEKLEKFIQELDSKIKRSFLDTFQKIGQEFDILFRYFFGGGKAELILTDSKDILESEIEINVQLPASNKFRNLQALSAGERTLTAIALLFATLKVKPSPFCILDELDATLDDHNSRKFAQLLKEFSKNSQFIIITHNKTTMEAADFLYGVTMEEPGVSKLLSVKLTDLSS